MEPNCEENGCEHISEIMKAIKAWDEFVTPIREFYGVPQYKPKPKTYDKYGNQVVKK